MSELYRDFIDRKADQIITDLGGTITPAPANAELYRDFLDRKFDDVINAIGNLPNIKSFKYTGTGTTPTTITFSVKPTIVFQIFGTFQNYVNYSGMIFRDSEGTLFNLGSLTPGSTTTLLRPLVVNWVNDTTLELTGESAQRALNSSHVDYTVYYI